MLVRIDETSKFSCDLVVRLSEGYMLGNVAFPADHRSCVSMPRCSTGVNFRSFTPAIRDSIYFLKS